MISDDHLSEEQRHACADGSLSLEQRAIAAAHLDRCDACRADVDRLGRLVTNASGVVPPTSGDSALDDIWRGVRGAIEQRKIVSMPASAGPTPESRSGKEHRRWLLAVAAAVIVVGSSTVLLRSGPRNEAEDVASVQGPALSAVAESTKVYENEVQTLLNELELRRALLRPETAASIDQSLRVIDQAIAELRDALGHDPNNPALRQLLASSYRQKVDLLKRVGNAA